MAVAKNGFEFIQYTDHQMFKDLVTFCAPYQLKKTKKYKQNGAVNFLGPTGAQVIVHGNYVVKLTDELFIVMKSAVFHRLFSKAWVMVDAAT